MKSVGELNSFILHFLERGRFTLSKRDIRIEKFSKIRQKR
jgi:hypothetical protein